MRLLLFFWLFLKFFSGNTEENYANINVEAITRNIQLHNELECMYIEENISRAKKRQAVKDCFEL